MTKLEEFVEQNLGYALYVSEKDYVHLGLRAFVKKVRRNTIQLAGHPDYVEAGTIGVAFNELVKELGLEE